MFMLLIIKIKLKKMFILYYNILGPKYITKSVQNPKFSIATIFIDIQVFQTLLF